MAKKLMFRKILNEAINVPDAICIGTAKGYDVFDILTYDAAQRFVIEDTADLAGAAYTHNSETFSSNINNNQHLYFFVQENTNKVYGAVVKGTQTHSDVTVRGSNNTNFQVGVNFYYEDARNNSSTLYYNKVLPIYLIPDYHFNPGGVTTELNTDGLLYEDECLIGAIPHFTEKIEIDIDTSDRSKHINAIGSDFATFGLTVNSIIIGDNVEHIARDAMRDVNQIYVTASKDLAEDDERFDSNWNCGKEVIYDYGRSPEDLARIEAERQRKAEEERLKAEEEARRRAEEARLQAEREARKIRYKVEGKNITILGTRAGIESLDIPETIEGKPVTKIASLAFYDAKDLKSITLPSTLKLIENGAFAESGLIRDVYIPRGCIVGKNAFLGCRVSIRRR